jgi:oligopeptide transport system substrate-binding protein
MDRGAPPRERRSAVALAVVSAALLCTACGRPADDTPRHADEGRALRRGLDAEPGTLDPRFAYDNAALAVAGDLYEGLTREAPDGTIVPGAAASWVVGADGLSFTFVLREGLRWSNGDPLSAEHFAAGLRAAADPDGTAPGAPLLEAITALEVVDDRTLRVRLERPLPYLPALLAMPMAAPLHPGTVQSDTPATNGPYRLLHRLPNERIELERNPHYWSAATVAIGRVDYLTIADIATQLKLYRAGDLDLTSEVPNAQLPFLRSNYAADLHVSPYLAVYAYAVNLSRLADRNARLALAMAVDRERITRQVTGAGEAPAFGWVPDGMPAYAPARFEWSDLPQDAASQQARELWNAARRSGSAPGRLVLCIDAGANHRRTAVAVADLWRTALGVQTEVVELEWRVFLDRRSDPGDCDLMRLGWSADFMDPEAFASLFETGDAQNTLGYSSAAYDGLLAESRLTAEPAQRMALLARAEAQLLEDIPVIPVFFPVAKRLVKPHVQGFGGNPLAHFATRNLSLVEPGTEKKEGG